VLARHHQVPFVVVAPTSTVDLRTPDGASITVEHRPAAEVASLAGQPVAPAGTQAYNPAFDITPPELVTALVTEEGLIHPVTEGSLRVRGPAQASDTGPGSAVYVEL
jgi:methylthioribose-1-phosphate isomerase